MKQIIHKRQSSKDCLKTKEKKKNTKLENNQHQIENIHYTENEIKINEMKQNIIRERAKVTNNHTKDSILQKTKKVQKQFNANKFGELFHKRSSSRL